MSKDRGKEMRKALAAMGTLAKLLESGKVQPEAMLGVERGGEIVNQLLCAIAENGIPLRDIRMLLARRGYTPVSPEEEWLLDRSPIIVRSWEQGATMMNSFFPGATVTLQDVRMLMRRDSAVYFGELILQADIEQAVVRLRLRKTAEQDVCLIPVPEGVHMTCFTSRRNYRDESMFLTEDCLPPELNRFEFDWPMVSGWCLLAQVGEKALMSAGILSRPAGLVEAITWTILQSHRRACDVACTIDHPQMGTLSIARELQIWHGLKKVIRVRGLKEDTLTTQDRTAVRLRVITGVMPD